MENTIIKHSTEVSVVCIIAAILFGLISLFIPPYGVIHSSVLILIAQFLVLSAGLLTNSATVVKHLRDLSRTIIDESFNKTK